MGRRRRHTTLGVFLNGRRVGHLRRAPSGALELQYARQWLDWEHAMPMSLSLPLRERRYTGDPVLAVLDNLLPDDDAIRRRVAERTGAEGTDVLSLLQAIGRDCVGALQLLPEGVEPHAPGEVSGHPVGPAEIAGIVRNLADSPLGLSRGEDFRISIAGAQEKTALVMREGEWLVPHGATPTTHILKPQIGTLPSGIDLSRSVENEYLCMQLVPALGLPAARAWIEDFDAERVLVVERFDRRWTGDGKRLLRVPQEDLCQALGVPSTRKYEADGGPGLRPTLELLKASDEPRLDRRTFFKAHVVYWLLGATDGHAKNFSIQIYPGGRFRLAPLYDVLSAQPALGEHQLRRNAMKLAMAVGDNRHYAVHEIRPRHFLQSAELCGIPADTAQEVLHELARDLPAALDAVTSALPTDLPDALVGSIADGARERARLIRG